MQSRSRQELYECFLDFVANDLQLERRVTNRRMLSVFIWCFFLPALMSITILLMVKLQFLPKKFKAQLDWFVLVFPICYSLYILGSEVLAQVPSTFRKGGFATTLAQAAREGSWRERVVENMDRAISARTNEWEWVVASFSIDLEAMQYRTRYLTALAGAVFFLLMQGIDSLYDSDGKLTVIKTTILGWVESSSSDLSQFVGLALFLTLLYLSGSQTNQSLRRYLCCAKLLVDKKR